MVPPLPRTLVRYAVTAIHRLRKAVWFVTRPNVRGAHAVALTPEGRIVLVRLTYAQGWRLPGGGVGRRETPEAAVLRELREEIGLTAHGALRPARDLVQKTDYRHDHSTIYVVDRVLYSPRRTLEVEEVREWDPRELPLDMPDCTREIVESLRLPPPLG